MKLSFSECCLFYKLHSALLCYANWTREILPERPEVVAEFHALEAEKRIAVRDAVHDEPGIISDFVEVNPFDFSSEELAIVASWKHAVADDFFILRYLKRYTIFLSHEETPTAYGVLALHVPLEDLIGPNLPSFVRTVLLPFQGKIVYDGLLVERNIVFGGGAKRALDDTYREAKAVFGIVTSLPFEAEKTGPKEGRAGHGRPGASRGGKGRPGGEETDTFPLRLSLAQRRAVAGLFPDFEPRLLLDHPNQRTVRFTLDEIKRMARAARAVAAKAATGRKRNVLRRVAVAAVEAAEKFAPGKIQRIPPPQRLYQFRITLKDIEPPIWRRIQVKDCSLDQLHEHIQTAMGWSNCHLHQFEIDGLYYGDPELLFEGPQHEWDVINSVETQLHGIVPEDGSRFAFSYEYDFGDSWEHEVLFEGCLRASKTTRYPLCVEGERACPPEDVGGTSGYAEYLEAIADPEHEEHESWLEWSGPFDPEAFDAEAATQRMRRGLGNWRTAGWM